MEKSRLDVRKNNAPRLAASCLYVLRPVKDDIPSSESLAGVVIRPHISDSFARSASPPLSRFFMLLISRIQFYTRPIWREDVAGEGKRVWGGRFRARTEIELETILHSLRRIRSTLVNLYIGRSEFPGFMLLTRPFAHFYFWCIIAIIIASVTCTNKIFINSFS